LHGRCAGEHSDFSQTGGSNRAGRDAISRKGAAATGWPQTLSSGRAPFWPPAVLCFLITVSIVRTDPGCDFDALIDDAVKLLRGEQVPAGLEVDEVRDRLLAGFQHILVDEYQDIHLGYPAWFGQNHPIHAVLAALQSARGD